MDAKSIGVFQPTNLGFDYAKSGSPTIADNEGGGGNVKYLEFIGSILQVDVDGSERIL